MNKCKLVYLKKKLKKEKTQFLKMYLFIIPILKNALFEGSYFSIFSLKNCRHYYNASIGKGESLFFFEGESFAFKYGSLQKFECRFLNYFNLLCLLHGYDHLREQTNTVGDLYGPTPK